MKHPGPSRKSRRFLLLGMFAILGILFLHAFADDKPPRPFESSVSDSLYTAKAEEAKESEAPPPKAVKPRNQVIVYVTSWCPACRMTTDYLKQKKIPFVVKDVERNEQYMKEMVKKVGGYRGVPVLDINGRIMLGFNPHVLDELAR